MEEPIVIGKIYYSPEYNYLLPGWRILKQFHKFPPDRYMQIMSLLQKQYGVNTVTAPGLNQELIDSFLEEKYRKKIYIDKKYVCEVLELPVFLSKIVPFSWLQKHVIRPMLLSTNGTIQGALAALQCRQVVNLGGGFHHASFSEGSGFCFFSDAAMAAKRLLEELEVHAVAIIDLDAHQGNGTAKAVADIRKALQSHKKIWLADICMFNPDFADLKTWPSDEEAATHVDCLIKIENPGWTDQNYLNRVNLLLEFIEEKKPDYIIYNAGVDGLKEDTVGAFLNLTADTLLERDRLVFELARKLNIPILMLLSGGYHPHCTEIVAESVNRLFLTGK